MRDPQLEGIARDHCALDGCLIRYWRWTYQGKPMPGHDGIEMAWREDGGEVDIRELEERLQAALESGEIE